MVRTPACENVAVVAWLHTALSCTIHMEVREAGSYCHIDPGVVVQLALEQRRVTIFLGCRAVNEIDEPRVNCGPVARVASFLQGLL